MKHTWAIGTIIILATVSIAIFIAGTADTQQRENFETFLEKQGFTIVQGSTDAVSARAYVNHASFIEFAHLNNITVLYQHGTYFDAYDPKTNVVYTTSVHWENYRQ